MWRMECWINSLDWYDACLTFVLLKEHVWRNLITGDLSEIQETFVWTLLVHKECTWGSLHQFILHGTDITLWVRTLQFWEKFGARVTQVSSMWHSHLMGHSNLYLCAKSTLSKITVNSKLNMIKKYSSFMKNHQQENKYHKATHVAGCSLMSSD